MAGCVPLCLAVLLSMPDVSGGTGSLSKNGNECYWTDGDTAPSSAYPEIGIMLSPSWIEAGAAAWAFVIDPAPLTYDFNVTLYYTEALGLGDGPDILMYNWTLGDWDTIGTAIGEGTNISRTVSPAAFGCENYVSDFGEVFVQVYADALDCTDIGTITVDWEFDSTPPSNPSIYAADPDVDVWTTDRTVEVEWSGAVDDRNDVDGYSISWSQSATALPDQVVDTTDNSTVSAPLADGEWYLLIRTVDTFDNWAPTAYTVGPFLIDTTEPSTPILVVTPESVTNDDTPEFAWAASSDAGSGVAGYSFSVDALPDETADTTSTFTILQSLSDGNHVFYVKTVDAVGNWGDTASYEFKVDTAVDDAQEPVGFFLTIGVVVAVAAAVMTVVVLIYFKSRRKRGPEPPERFEEKEGQREV